MTAEEVLKELEALFIITKISEQYFITEQYKTIEEKIAFIEEKTKEQISPYVEILSTVKKNTKWIESIAQSKGRHKVIALMDACQIPGTAGVTKYRLRGFNEDVVKAVDKLVHNTDIDPIIFIEATKQYYKTMDSPKGFKNFMLEGDAIEVYEEFANIKKLPSSYVDPKDKPNSTWG